MSPKSLAVAIDGVFSVGYNASTAAFTKPRTSVSSKKKTETMKISKAKNTTSIGSKEIYEQSTATVEILLCKSIGQVIRS